MKAENLGKGERVRFWNLDFPIESACAFYCRVDPVRMICRADDHDPGSLLNASKLFKQEVYDLGPVLDIITTKLRAIRDTVHFVDK